MQTTTSIMKLPDILKSVSPYIDTNLDVEDMWKLANVAYKSKMSGDEQVPPMKLLKEEHIGGATVLTVGNSDTLKQYIQDILNPPTPDPETEGAKVRTAILKPLVLRMTILRMVIRIALLFHLQQRIVTNTLTASRTGAMSF